MASVILVALATFGVGVSAGKSPQDGKADLPVIRVLWLGNSYTFFNDLPGMFANYSQHLPNDKAREVNFSKVVPGGSSLFQHANLSLPMGQETDVALADSNGWDYVMLQDQSETPGCGIDSDSGLAKGVGCKLSRDALANFYRPRIQKARATPVLYSTWGRHDGDPANSCCGYDTFLKMTALTTDGYRNYSTALLKPYGKQQSGALIAPCGRAYELIFNTTSDPTGEFSRFTCLYNHNLVANQSCRLNGAGHGGHPSLRGTFLIASVFVATVHGVSPVGVEWAPKGINEADRKYLQQIAHDAVFSNNAVTDIDTKDVNTTTTTNNNSNNNHNNNNFNTNIKNTTTTNTVINNNNDDNDDNDDNNSATNNNTTTNNNNNVTTSINNNDNHNDDTTNNNNNTTNDTTPTTNVGVHSITTSTTTTSCPLMILSGSACTDGADVKLIPPLTRTATNLSDCCRQCATLATTTLVTCGAFTFRGTVTTSGGCLLAKEASAPGVERGATCGTIGPAPPPRPPPTPPSPPPPTPPLRNCTTFSTLSVCPVARKVEPCYWNTTTNTCVDPPRVEPPLQPLPPRPTHVQSPALVLERSLIMFDTTGFLRDPSSPVFDEVSQRWHAWVVYVPPVYGQEGWSGFIKHFSSPTLAENWTNHGLALNHSTDPLAFDHSGMCSPGAQYDADTKTWYLFYTGATPEHTTGFPPRSGGSPMDNLSAQGVASSSSPFGPWKKLGITAPGGLGWDPQGKGGGFRANVWNGLRVDSGRPMVINNTKVYFTKGIGNGTGIPNQNYKGTYQALQGAFLPPHNDWSKTPYTAYTENPITRANFNTYTIGGSENCEFMASPGDGMFHATCAAHGAAYPLGYIPHYIVTLINTGSDSSKKKTQPIIQWQFVEFLNTTTWAAEPTPVYQGIPGDTATVEYNIARNAGGISLYALTWVKH